jgi:hypothetical protein
VEEVVLPCFPSNAFEEVESPKNGIDEIALYSKEASTGCIALWLSFLSNEV